MLRDEDWLLVALDVGQEFGGLTLEGSNEFGTHEVILKYHFQLRKSLLRRARQNGSGWSGLPSRVPWIARG
jgi:hypothetical protein